MRRRDLLGAIAALPLLGACSAEKGAPKIGLALGGGGAKGLAHIPILEVFDSLGLKPHRIAGCSVGAVIGALYASGMSGRAIRETADRLTVSADEDWLDSIFSEDIGRWFDFIELKLGNGGLLDASPFIAYLQSELGLTTFEALAIPLDIVATDFWSREQVVFNSGDLPTAINASIAIPGLFEPVRYRDRVLVDGGLVNPVPYDLLFAECDLVVAVDVLGQRTPSGSQGPGYFETTFNTFQIMQASIMREKLQARSPDIYSKPQLKDIRVLEFYKADIIYAQAESERRRVEKLLRAQLNRG